MSKKTVVKVSAVETTPEFENLLEAVEAMREDFVRFSRNNKSAGKRLRRQLLDIGKWTKEARKEIIQKIKLLNSSVA